jgi:hypothetical protein
MCWRGPAKVAIAHPCRTKRDAPAESLTGDFGQPDAEVEDHGRAGHADLASRPGRGMAGNAPRPYRTAP